MDQETSDHQVVHEPVNDADSINEKRMEKSGNSDVDRPVPEVAIVITSDEEEPSCIDHRNVDSVHSDVKANVLDSNKVSVDELKLKELKDEKLSSSIDVKCDGKLGENLDGESVCRICHLNSSQSSENNDDAMISDAAGSDAMALIQLGCGCKDELGIAHLHCAEAWFKLKGNRLCEICGKSARNITGVGDSRFMEEWNEGRSNTTNLSERRGGFWRGQPLCNFLLACLVIAFVLPWFLRVNMF